MFFEQLTSVVRCYVEAVGDIIESELVADMLGYVALYKVYGVVGVTAFTTYKIVTKLTFEKLKPCSNLFRCLFMVNGTVAVRVVGKHL